MPHTKHTWLKGKVGLKVSLSKRSGTCSTFTTGVYVYGCHVAGFLNMIYRYRPEYISHNNVLYTDRRGLSPCHGDPAQPTGLGGSGGMRLGAPGRKTGDIYISSKHS